MSPRHLLNDLPWIRQQINKYETCPVYIVIFSHTHSLSLYLSLSLSLQVILMFLVLLVLSLVSAVGSTVWNSIWAEKMWYLHISTGTYIYTPLCGCVGEI